MQELKNKIIEIGKLLWDKGLVTAFNGNISVRVDANTVLITATGVCLGYLSLQDLVLVNTSGEVIGNGKASSEKLMHTEIYKNLPQVQAVIHTHSTYTSAFFLTNERFIPKTFEAKFYLGEVKSIEQYTPAVTDTAPVIKELLTNNIIVLRNHGVVAVGQDLFHAFVLIQELEEQLKMQALAALYSKNSVRQPGDMFNKEQKKNVSPSTLPTNEGFQLKATQRNPLTPLKKFKLFSKDQIEEIVRLVNSDEQMQELGKKTAMNMDLAVCLQETGAVHSFKFVNGYITKTGDDAQAEFLITANESIWRAVFNREIDPFVATTQKKMSLRGDFARISKWYAPCSRIFQLWTRVPVE
ncbi:MAG: class II aldolase/adducin family protein [Candidatus Omnitrophica bacterium]|nr:class II aldolase/adducin family protein [Candidatus Omnitrophota bacterium]